jgi:large subunit ribosomal protein L1
MPKKSELEENIVEETQEKLKVEPKKINNSSKDNKKIKGKKLVEALKLVDTNRKYDYPVAIELVKKTSYTKFDGTVEMHIKTSLKKGQELLRGLVEMPAGSAKLPKVVIADENVIEEIKANKINFDILIATPALMPKLATVARILGPKGLMPSPKSGTVVEDPKKALEEFRKGKVEYKSDPLGNIHIPVGKVSWSVEKLESNIKAVLSSLPTGRIVSISLSATMGPGVKVK